MSYVSELEFRHKGNKFIVYSYNDEYVYATPYCDDDLESYSNKGYNFTYATNLHIYITPISIEDFNRNSQYWNGRDYKNITYDMLKKCMVMSENMYCYTFDLDKLNKLLEETRLKVYFKNLPFYVYSYGTEYVVLQLESDYEKKLIQSLYQVKNNALGYYIEVPIDDFNKNTKHNNFSITVNFLEDFYIKMNDDGSYKFDINEINQVDDEERPFVSATTEKEIEVGGDTDKLMKIKYIIDSSFDVPSKYQMICNIIMGNYK